MNLKDIKKEISALIEKGGYNAHSKYKYYKPEDINKAVVEVLWKHGYDQRFYLKLHPENTAYMQGTYSIIKLETSEVCETWVFDIGISKQSASNPSQETGGTMTYCKRYMQMNAFDLTENGLDFDSSENDLRNQAEMDKLNQGGYLQRIEYMCKKNNRNFGRFKENLKKMNIDVNDEKEVVRIAKKNNVW